MPNPPPARVKLTAPPEFVARLTKAETFDIDVCGTSLPSIEGLPTPYDWVGTSPYGCTMHDDQHMPRFSVLWVAENVPDDRWDLRVWDGKRVKSVDAYPGQAILLDAHKAHALQLNYDEQRIKARGPWVALCWMRDDKRAAERLYAKVVEVARGN